jgi:hypothetical protein
MTGHVDAYVAHTDALGAAAAALLLLLRSSSSSMHAPASLLAVASDNQCRNKQWQQWQK